MNHRNIVRDLKRRKLVDLLYIDRSLVKSIALTESGDVAKGALRRFPRDSSPVRVVNRCTVTGFARSERTFGLSRFELRRHSRQGLLPGVVKAVW